jgi:hydroxyacylglutathione hydrolase
MIVSSVTVGPFAENSYLLVEEDSRKAVLVDPGDEGARIVREVKAARATLQAIWLTHAHLDLLWFLLGFVWLWYFVL